MYIRHNMTGQQGTECTESSPTMCNEIKDIKTIIHIIHTKSKIIYVSSEINPYSNFIYNIKMSFNVNNHQLKGQCQKVSNFL